MSQFGPSGYGSEYGQPYNQPYNQQPPDAQGAGSSWGGTPNPWPGSGDAAPPPYGPPSTAPNAPYPGYQGYPPTEQTYPGYGAPPSQGFPPGYGNPQQNPYGPYGAPPPPTPPRKNRVGMIIAIVVGVVLLACVGGVALLYALGNAVESQLPAASATLTAAAQQSPSVQGTPAPTVIYQDALNTSSTGWSDDNDCSLQKDGLHVRDSILCFSPAGSVTNAEVSVQVKETKGDTLTPYGIAMRHASQGNYYDFDIDGNSKAVIFKCAATTSSCSTLLDYTPNTAIQGGLNVTNALDVKAVGSHFTFSVNSTVVAQIDDATYSSGIVALDAGDNLEAVYTNLKITSAS